MREVEIREGFILKGAAMKVFSRAFFVWVFVGVTSAVSFADTLTPFSKKQQKDLQGVLSVLLALYDDDASLIPNDPNAIMALEFSEDPRDQLAWGLFTILRHITDPYAMDPAEESSPELDSTEVETKVLDSSEPEMAASFWASSESGTEMRYVAAEPIEDLENSLGSRILAPKTGTERSLKLRKSIAPVSVIRLAPQSRSCRCP